MELFFSFYTGTLGTRVWHGEQKRAKWGNNMAERCTFPSLGKCLHGEKGIQKFKLSAYSSAGNCHEFNVKKLKFILQTAVFWIVTGGNIDTYIFNICPVLLDAESVMGERRLSSQQICLIPWVSTWDHRNNRCGSEVLLIPITRGLRKRLGNIGEDIGRLIQYLNW